MASYALCENVGTYPVISPVTVVKKDLMPLLKATGSVTAINGASLSVQSSGIIDLIRVQPGQIVKKDDMLLQLDSSSQKASLGTAKTAYDKAAVEYARQLSLFKSNVISQETLDQYVVNLSDAESNLVAAQVQLDNRTLKAPYDGQIGVVNVNVGEYIKVGEELISLQDLSKMRVIFDIDQSDTVRVKPNMRFDFISGDISLRGSILALDTKVNQNSGQVNVQGELINKDRLVLSGQLGQIDISLAPIKDQVIIPLIAVNFRLSGNFVYVIENIHEENGLQVGVVKQKIIELGEQNNNFVTVKSGLKADQVIVAVGSGKIVSSNIKVILDEKTPLPFEAI